MLDGQEVRVLALLVGTILGPAVPFCIYFILLLKERLGLSLLNPGLDRFVMPLTQR